MNLKNFQDLEVYRVNNDVAIRLEDLSMKFGNSSKKNYKIKSEGIFLMSKMKASMQN